MNKNINFKKIKIKIKNLINSCSIYLFLLKIVYFNLFKIISHC